MSKSKENKIVENLRYMLDSLYGEKIIWEKDNKTKARLTKKRNELSDNVELLKELKDIRAYIDLGINILEKERGIER